MEEIKDKFGEPLAVGDKIIYVTNEEIKKGKIIDFPQDVHEYAGGTYTTQYVKVIGDGAKRWGNTYPNRIIKITENLLK